MAQFPKHLAVSVGCGNDPAFERNPPRKRFFKVRPSKSVPRLIAGKSTPIGQAPAGHDLALRIDEVYGSASTRAGAKSVPDFLRFEPGSSDGMGPRAPSNTMVERPRILLALDELIAIAFMSDRAIGEIRRSSRSSFVPAMIMGVGRPGFVPAPVSIVMAPQVQYLSRTPRFHNEGSLGLSGSPAGKGLLSRDHGVRRLEERSVSSLSFHRERLTSVDGTSHRGLKNTL